MNDKPQPLPGQISIQEIIQIRLALDGIEESSPSHKETLTILDDIILNFAQSMTPNKSKGN